MANNRLSIRCKACGKSITIAKSYGTGFYVDDGIYGERGCNNLTEALNNFFEEHQFCCWEGLYGLDYESDLDLDCTSCEDSDSCKHVSEGAADVKQYEPGHIPW